MKNLSLNEMENVSGGGWFSQMFGRDWGECMQFVPGSNGELGDCRQRGVSWLWGSGTRPCDC